MKKILLLVLLVASINLVSCGTATNEAGTEPTKTLETETSPTEEVASTIISESTEVTETDNSVEQVEEPEISWEMEDDILVIHLSPKQLAEKMKIVTLTKENWSQYFGDYEYTVHNVKTNSFGDIEDEYDVTVRGFGLKGYGWSSTNVSFKFSGMTLKDINTGMLHKYEIGQDTFKIYDENGELVNEYTCENKEYYLLDGIWSDYWYEEYECLDVVGKVTVLDLSFVEKIEEYYNENIKLDFTDGSGSVTLARFLELGDFVYSSYLVGCYEDIIRE